MNFEKYTNYALHGAYANYKQMAVGDLMDTTSGAGFIPELWSDAIYSFFFQANKLRGSVSDYSSLVKGKGDTIHIPAILMQTAQAKTASAAVAWDTNKGSTPKLTMLLLLIYQSTHISIKLKFLKIY